jgi:hypothetical protein
VDPRQLGLHMEPAKESVILNGNLYGNIEPYATGFLKFLIFTQFTMNNQEIRLGMQVAMVHKVCLSIYKSLCSRVFLLLGYLCLLCF